MFDLDSSPCSLVAGTMLAKPLVEVRKLNIVFWIQLSQKIAWLCDVLRWENKIDSVLSFLIEYMKSIAPCWSVNIRAVLVWHTIHSSRGVCTARYFLHYFFVCLYLSQHHYFISLKLAMNCILLKTPKANSTEGPAKVNRQFCPLDIPKTLTFCQQLDIHIDAILHFQ